MSRKILVFDTTLRDGEQSPGCSMTISEKLRMAAQLEQLGVNIIEAGFPVASAGDFQAVNEIAGQVKRATVAALCRAGTDDIDRAWAAIAHANNPRLHTFIATSDIHLEHKLRLARNQVLAIVDKAVRHARTYCDDVEFSAEDASRSDHAFLAQVVQVAIDAGATTINLPDTVGYATPEEYANMFSEVQRMVPDCKNITLSAHTHDDLGMAVANSLAAVMAGVNQVECTVNGIGERAGNASLEEVVMAIQTRNTVYKAKTDINTRELMRTSKMLTQITGVDVQPNKAIVGRNAFAHEAGIHQDGMLKNSLTYEIMTPESVGLDGSKLVLGKHSGRHAIAKRCEELGFNLTNEQINHIYAEFTALADTQKHLTDEDLKRVILNRQNSHQREPVNFIVNCIQSVF